MIGMSQKKQRQISWLGQFYHFTFIDKELSTKKAFRSTI